MNSSEYTLEAINYYLTVYSGYATVIPGLIGHMINIMVFTKLRLFRGNPSAFYLIIGSIFDSWQLLFLTTPRFASVASGYDATRISLFWCKLRAYLVNMGAVILTINICFAAIDQYLSTNYYHRLRQLSTYKLAQRAVAVLIIFALLYAVIFLFYFEIQIICGTFNPGFNYFYSFVHFCLFIGLFPIVISLLFSCLAYQNVRRIVRRPAAGGRRRLDHQLTAMILVRVALFVCTTVPYVSLRIYQINHSPDQNDPFAVAVDQVIRTCFNIVYTIDTSAVFYIFLISSPRYRRQVRYILFKKNWRKTWANKIKRNRIVANANQAQAIESPQPSVELD
ncbi:unnamed protein product [Adineta ricciae]|uniref:G-protein coupled receptors family 1 profile domain-containing protein n=1 Tax=Adineta ricciae TaxID=249248 RepID=A0A813YWX2_ADIRI|nr:unnamed protein product [Adineta ricciae]CAF1265726.1 unnamed protein product [Adineta ricciae]